MPPTGSLPRGDWGAAGPAQCSSAYSFSATVESVAQPFGRQLADVAETHDDGALRPAPCRTMAKVPMRPGYRPRSNRSPEHVAERVRSAPPRRSRSRRDGSGRPRADTSAYRRWPCVTLTSICRDVGTQCHQSSRSALEQVVDAQADCRIADQHETAGVIAGRPRRDELGVVDCLSSSRRLPAAAPGSRTGWPTGR